MGLLSIFCIIKRENREREEEKTDKGKKKIEKTYKKIVSLIHQLAKQDLLSMEKFSCDNNEKTILHILKLNNAVYHQNCISNNQQELKRSLEKRKRDNDKKKEAKANKRSKEAISKRHHRSFWESISACSVE